jgi:hypothetical protein
MPYSMISGLYVWDWRDSDYFAYCSFGRTGKPCKFGISRFVPEHYMFVDRIDALKQAVALVNPHATYANNPGVAT